MTRNDTERSLKEKRDRRRSGADPLIVAVLVSGVSAGYSKRLA
jgi:hypothetical protein